MFDRLNVQSHALVIAVQVAADTVAIHTQVESVGALSGEAKARRVAGMVRRKSFMQRYVLDLDNRDARHRELAELWYAPARP